MIRQFPWAVVRMVDRLFLFPRGRWSRIQSGAFTGVVTSGAQMLRASDRRDGKVTTHQRGSSCLSMVDPGRALVVSPSSLHVKCPLKST